MLQSACSARTWAISAACFWRRKVYSSASGRSGGEWAAPLTVRTPSGGGIRGGLYHSQSPEAYFAHTPGLCVVMPSNPYAAKGLLIRSLESAAPFFFFEPKRLYRGAFEGDPERVPPWREQPEAEVPAGYYRTPLAQAA